MTITNTDITIYKNALIEELKKFGACATELRMVTDEIIKSSILENIKPKEVAWAMIE